MQLRGLDEIQSSLATIPVDDPIHQCGSATLAIIRTRPSRVILLAHRKLHAYPYENVPTCWKRLYEDASVWAALELLEEANRTQIHQSVLAVKRSFDGGYKAQSTTAGLEDDLLRRVVAKLDRALILTGAPKRAALIHRILADLERHLSTSTSASASVSANDERPPDLPSAFPSPPMSTRQIPDTFVRQKNPSLASFQAHLDTSPTPIVITDALSHLPAISSTSNLWSSPSYLLRATLDGARLVPVEIGRSYTDTDWSQKIVTFKTFLTDHLLSKPGGTPTGYLAQHDLLAQIPSLATDIPTPDYVYACPPSFASASASGLTPVQSGTTKHVAPLDEPLRNTWMGPAGTISPLHTDPYHNILCQIVGRKFIRLYAPSQGDRLYPFGIDEKGIDMGNTSRVDLSIARRIYAEHDAAQTGRDELSRARKDEFENEFPRFKDAVFVQGVLNAGECLYIPVGWWHYVESLEVSINVSYWFN